MFAPRFGVALLVLSIMGGEGAFAGAASISPAVNRGLAPGEAAGEEPLAAVTPARVSDTSGEVSFWRPGTEGWEPAAPNTPLAPGDVLATGAQGNVEIQVGPRAFVRAAEGTQLVLDHHEAGFMVFRLTAGHAALDLRELAPGFGVELDTPNAAFTLERPGYYHAHVTPESTAFRAHGGHATLTLASGASSPVSANQQVVVTGSDGVRVEMGAAPGLSPWDRWVRQRTDRVLQVASARYVPPDVYGAEALDQQGRWRAVEPYGPVWVPAAVPAGWMPYSTGRWIWDPRFGWTWLDDAPWGWAPYHYGRWVFVGNYWAWAPGPVVARPAYAPALVVFLGGGSVVVGRPLCWAPLGWGEPVVPWWGRPGFAGKPWWGGWGGPRVINNVIIQDSVRVEAAHIRHYRHVNVTRAVVGAPAERFGRERAELTRFSRAQLRDLTVAPPPARRGVEASAAPGTTRRTPGSPPPLIEHGTRRDRATLAPAVRPPAAPTPKSRPAPAEHPKPETPARVTRPEQVERPAHAPAMRVPAPPTPAARPARVERPQIQTPQRVTRPEQVERPVLAPHGEIRPAPGRRQSLGSRG